MNDKQTKGKQWLENLLNLMGISANIQEEGFEKITEDTNSCWLNIDKKNLTPSQIKLLIGEKGSNIDAIQYLANTILNIDKKSSINASYTIELDSYRVTRYQELKTIITDVAERVRTTGKATEIPNLSSAERRQVHSYFQETPDLQSESQGQEPHRKLIVKLRSID